jgi:hypothetical protein
MSYEVTAIEKIQYKKGYGYGYGEESFTPDAERFSRRGGMAGSLVCT